MTPRTPPAIVITGCGWVTPFGCGPLDPARTSTTPATAADMPSDGYWAIPDAFLNEFPSLNAELRQDRGAWVTALAFEHARRQAGPPETLPAERVGMVLGCALAGQLGMIAFANEVRSQSARFVSPIHFPQTVGNYIAGALARSYNIRGPNNTLAAGLASGLDAVVQGCALLSAESADWVYAGGSDTLSPPLAMGLAQGNVPLSEGACLFVLEREPDAVARGAKPLAKVIAHGAWPATLPTGARVFSAGVHHAGAIDVEQRVGRCHAASGAAALAEAITAASEAPTTHAFALADADCMHSTWVRVTGWP